jgi:hypothetical protein
MNTLIKDIQLFIKEEKQDLIQFEVLREILVKHLINKNKKMKDLTANEFIYYIDDIRTYVKTRDGNRNELLNNIAYYLYEIESLTF